MESQRVSFWSSASVWLVFAFLTIALIVPQTAMAVIIQPACGLLPNDAGPPPEYELHLRAASDCTYAYLQEDTDSETIDKYSAWQNLKWLQSPRLLDPWNGVFELRNSLFTPNYGHTITLKTLTVEDIELTPNANIFEFFGTDPALTLNGGTIDLPQKPYWKEGQNLTIAAGTGVQDPTRTSTIRYLNGNQGPTTSFVVPTNTTLQLYAAGTLGSLHPDTSRLNFITPNNQADIQGLFDINLSHVILPTGDSRELLISNGGELKIRGSNQTTLDTGKVRATSGGKITLESGDNNLIATTLIVDGATMVVGDNAKALVGSVDATGAPSTITVGSNPGGFVSELVTDYLGVPAPLTLDGYGKVTTDWVQPFVDGKLTLADALVLEIAGGTPNSWITGSGVDIGTDATLLISAGQRVFSIVPLSNDGIFEVGGTLEASGTMTGSGKLEVLYGGKLGRLGFYSSDTFTVEPGVSMRDNSALEVLINPGAATAQKLVAQSALELGPNGVFLNLIVDGTDTVMPDGTTLVIVDYPDSNDLKGHFLKPDGSEIKEGDLIKVGLNQFEFSYADPNFGSSAVTLTVNNVFTVGGLLSGLVTGDTVVLQNNNGDDLLLNADGSFTFATPVAAGDAYAVTVKTQPAAPSETCTVSNGSGTMPTDDITNVSVTCAVNTFTVGGTLIGLANGGSVTLQMNGSFDQTITADGNFVFPALADGSTYTVTVATQPTGQTCTVNNDSGTLAGANVSDIEVHCIGNNYSLGGTLTGLAAGSTVVLQNGVNDVLSLNADGAFTFTDPVLFDASYAVFVKTQPSSPTQFCTVTRGSGTMPANDVNNVLVTCTVTRFTVGASVSGLASSQNVVLLNNGTDAITIFQDGGPYSFPMQLPDGSPYNVTVRYQPDGKTCTVTNGSGTVSGATVTDPLVTCVDNEYTLGGHLSGLVSGDTVVLQNNGGDDLTLTADGSFTFPSTLNLGDAYTVTVLTQPQAPSETCTVSNGSGTMPDSNVNDVAVTCTVDTFTVGGALTGLINGDSVVLQVNGSHDQTLTADGNFVFPALADGTTYTVTVATQPKGQTCTVSNGSGQLAGADVSNVSVSCVENTYTVGGLLSGLVDGDTVVLQNNGGDDLPLNADGSFTFNTSIEFGKPYAVTVKTQPDAPSETCTVAAGSGLVPAGNVTNVAVTCAIDTFSVGGTLTGLASGGSVALQVNGSHDQTLTADGSFVFPPLADGTDYTVTVATQPTGQTCSVSNGSGTLAGAPVNDVNVSCVDNTYSVGGLLSGLVTGGMVVLQNNGGDDLSLNADGNFVFPPLADGTDYTVTVATQPTGQICTVSNGSGTLAGADVSDVDVSCTLLYKGIPVLDRYGLVLLALLMLGVGFIGMRRYA